MSTPRAKPWEVASGTSTAAVSGSTTQAPLGSDSEAPAAVPERPTSLTDPSSSSSYNYGQASSGYGSTGYGTGYGGSRSGSGLGGSMYGSGYGSSMYGGYGSGIGGYGSSMYGGYGSGMGGYGGYGSSMYGGYGGGMYGPNGMQGPGGIAEGTQATFQLIESIIGAVGGFAQMLEATYMATHSSFFTMVSLAEQFGNLKNTLGSLLGIFAIIKFAKKLLYKISGRTYNHGISAEDFAKFQNNKRSWKKVSARRHRVANPASPSNHFCCSWQPLLASHTYSARQFKSSMSNNSRNSREDFKNNWAWLQAPVTLLIPRTWNLLKRFMSSIQKIQMWRSS